MYQKAVRGVKLDGNPGFPYNLRFAVNKDALDDSELFGVVRARLHKWLTASDEELALWSVDPIASVTAGVRDPLCPFVKAEGNPARKTVTGKYRYVSALSLADQLVERVVFEPFQRALKAGYPEYGPAIGIGFDDFGAERFYQMMKRRYGTRLIDTNDIGGFDAMTSQQIVCESSLAIGRRLKPGATYQHLRRALQVWAVTSTNLPYAIGDGSLLAKKEVGVMPSGSYNTTTVNSIDRDIMAELASPEVSPNPTTAGDDCIELHNLDSVEDYAAIGITLRDVMVECVEDFHFCSHHFVNGVPSLDTWPKAVNKFFTNKLPTVEQFAGLVYETRHNGVEFSDKLECCVRACAEVPGAAQTKYKEILAFFY